MGDNIRRKMQDITLGLNDAPIAIPKSVCAQAARVNRFSIIGALVNPRKQNMRALIGQLSRLWGMEDNVVGRIIDARKFQFVFQSEESLNMILQRGPWSFSEWMLVTHRWVPNMPEETMKIIPFWTQIHGIPAQYLTVEMIDVIGRSMGQVTGIDFDESAQRVDYVRVRLNWNIDHPLRFKRNLQFGHDENDVFSFRYERLRNFCVICGLITHDKKECPLRFDVDDDPDFPDAQGDDDMKNNGDNADVPDQDNVKPENQTPKRGKLDPSMVARPSTVNEIDSEKSFSLIMDRDLTAETWNYLQAKRAKGKFTDDDFLDLINKYSNEGVARACAKRLRTEENAMYHGQGKWVNDEYKESSLGEKPVAIPGISPQIRVHNGIVLSEMSQGLDFLKHQSEEERAQMIQRFKGNFDEKEYIEVIEDYALKGGNATQVKRQKLGVEMRLQDSLQDKSNWKALFPIAAESLMESEGSCEVVQRIDGGAGGPIPPPVP